MESITTGMCAIGTAMVNGAPGALIFLILIRISLRNPDILTLMMH
jgi:hypothetical protein